MSSPQGRIQNAFYQVHLWVGILTGIVAVALGISGSILMFRPELERAANPALATVSPYSSSTSVQKLVNDFRASHPDANIRGITLPEPGEASPVVFMVGNGNRNTRTAIDASSGRELPSSSGGWIPWTVRLHHSLFAQGHFYTGIAGWALTILCISGLIVWWPSIAALPFDAALRSSRLRNWRARDWHVFAGFWLLVPLAILAFSGTVFTWRDAYTRAASFVTRASANAAPPKVSADGDARNVNLDGAINAARTAVPGGVVRMVRTPSKPGDPVVVRLRMPGELRRIGSTQVFVGASAQVVAVDRLSDKSFAVRAVDALAPLHMGEFGGWPLKILWTFAGFVPALLFFTGVWLTWRKYGRRTSKPLARDLQPSERLSVVTR